MELEKLDKIGPKTAKTLNNLGIYSSEDLIRNYPYRFLIFAKSEKTRIPEVVIFAKKACIFKQFHHFSVINGFLLS